MKQTQLPAVLVVLVVAVVNGSLGTAKTSVLCPEPAICVLQGRHPCDPDAIAVSGPGSTEALRLCGSCRSRYHEISGKCVTSSEFQEQMLIDIIQKTRWLLMRNQSRLLGRQQIHASSTPAKVKPATQKTTTSTLPPDDARSLPDELRPTSKAVIRLAHSLLLLPTQASTEEKALTMSPTTTDSPPADVMVTKGQDAAPHPEDSETSVVRMQPRPAAVFAAEKLAAGRHESVLHIENSHDTNPSATGGGKAGGVEGLGKLSHLLFFVLVLSACLLTAVLLTTASVFWYRLRLKRGYLRKNRACDEAELPTSAEYKPLAARIWPRNIPASYSGRSLDRRHRRTLTLAVGDGKLAQSALRHHYERSKLQMLSSSSLSSLQHDRSTTSDNNDSSDDDNDGISKEQALAVEGRVVDDEYTVYECPGLAPTAELEVHNPFFDSKCHRSSSGSSNVGQP